MVHKKAMSMIVTTVIMVALTLVAIGVVWAVISTLIENQSEAVSLQADCLEVNIDVMPTTSCIGTTCTIYIERKVGGKDIAGVKVVFNDGSSSGNVLDLLGNIVPLATVMQTFANVGVSNATEVGVTAYFLDDAGNERICRTTNTQTL